MTIHQKLDTLLNMSTKSIPIHKRLKINTYNLSTVTGSINVGVDKILFIDVFPVLDHYEWYPTGAFNTFDYNYSIDNDGNLNISIRLSNGSLNNAIPYADFDVYIF